MKKNYLNLMWLAVAAIFFIGCSDDNDPVIPKLSIMADVVEISETATSALVVKVTADATVGTAYNVGISLSGTAVEGVNFQDIAKTITIPADASSANIFVTPINVSAIEDSKTVTIELKAGTAYELTATANVAITIVDNANPPTDAPEVSFATSNIVTNPYLEEVKTITVGLSKTFASDLTIPLTITGDLVADTDYEIAGLTNDAITIPAGAVSADITVTMKNTAVVDMDKTLEFAFTAPTVTDYAVKATENTFAINAVDPQVDFSSWFNDDNKFNYFYEDWTTSSLTYKTDLEAYWLKRYYYSNDESDWKLLSANHYFDVAPTDGNQWKEVINIYQKVLGGKGIDIAEQERYEVQGFDFIGLTYHFGDEAKYGKNLLRSEKGWFRFVSTDAEATEGTVVVPEQTLTFYKIKDGSGFTDKFTMDVDGSTETYYTWYADSRTTQGDMSQSALVTPVNIQIAKSVGIYNTSTKEVIIDITFTCDDTSLDIDPKYVYSQDGDSYTMRIKYINRY